MPCKIAASPAPIHALRLGTVPEPARNLSKDGRALQDRLHAEYEITDEASLDVVLQVCSAVDMAEDILRLSYRNFVSKVLKNQFGEPKRGPGRPPGRGGNPW